MRKWKTALALLLAVTITTQMYGCMLFQSENQKESGEEVTAQTTEKETRPATEEEKAEQQRFKEYTDKLFKDAISNNCLSVHYMFAHPEDYGIEDYEITFGHFSHENDAEEKKEMEDYEREFKEFDYDLLDEEQQMVYDLMMYEVEASKESEGYYLYTNVFSNLMGVQADIPVILAEYTFYDEEDIKDYLTLLQQVRPYLEEAVGYQREREEAGFYMADFQADEVIDQCEKFVSGGENHYLIQSFQERIDATDFLTTEEKNSYIAMDKKIIMEEVLPAYTYLKGEIQKSKGKGSFKGGLCNYENGVEYYRQLVKATTCSDRSVEEIEEMLEQVYAADQKEVLKLALKSGFDLDSIYDYDKDVDNPEKILETLQEKIRKDFPELQDVDFQVHTVPKSMEEHTNPAYYILSPLDDAGNNPIYINESQVEKNLSEFSTLAHEGFPGHLYQTQYFRKTERPLARYLFEYNGYVEGWGTYAEQYSYRLADISETQANLNGLNTKLSFYLYCMCDIGIHFHGWSEEETIEWLKDKSVSQHGAEEMYKTLVENPAVYLTYYIGYLEFLNLRTKMKKEMGDDYNVKDFHTFILQTGPAPFSILEEKMEAFIKEKKGN